MSDFIVKTLECEEKYTMVEVQPDTPMIRAGSSSFMANMELHHNDDKITEDTKREVATQFAQFIVEQLHIPLERVLVLFFDTRCTTLQMTHL